MAEETGKRAPTGSHNGNSRPPTGSAEAAGTLKTPAKTATQAPKGPGARRGRPIYNPDRAARLVGQSINSQGNELAFKKRAAGREDSGDGASPGSGGRPASGVSARYSTGVNPLESVSGPYLHRA